MTAPFPDTPQVNNTGQQVNNTGQQVNNTGQRVNNTGQQVNNTGQVPVASQIVLKASGLSIRFISQYVFFSVPLDFQYMYIFLYIYTCIHIYYFSNKKIYINYHNYPTPVNPALLWSFIVFS